MASISLPTEVLGCKSVAVRAEAWRPPADPGRREPRPGRTGRG